MEMKSLYSTMFEHWRANDREALEPFLTRAIADLLQRVSKDNVQSVRNLIFDIFLNPSRRTSGTLSDENLRSLHVAINATESFEWIAELPIAVDASVVRRK